MTEIGTSGAGVSVPLRVGTVFAGVLRAGRTDFNRRFAEARHEFPDLDGDAFRSFLVETVEPWVLATDEVSSDAVPGVAQVGFDVGLRLVGQRLAGPGARVSGLDAALVRLLTAGAVPASEDPLRAAASFGNAILQLMEASGDVDEWIRAMENAAEASSDLATLLSCGQVLAWRCGLAHYRDTALARAEGLPGELAAMVLGVGDDDPLDALIERLRSDPWHRPGNGGETSHGPVLAHRVGGFRGFGGLFAQLPRVVAMDGHLVAVSGDRAWQVTADAFGCTIHQMGDAAHVAIDSEERVDLPVGCRWTAQGLNADLGQRRAQLDLGTEGAVRSSARVGSTLAVTTEATYDVLVVALPWAEAAE